MSTSTTTLPKTPSALIRAALRDLRECEDDNRYVVDMEEWHRPVHYCGREVCHVCLAGAVLAQTLGAPRERRILDYDLEQYGRVEDGLRALDCFRLGEISAGLEMLNFDLSALDAQWTQYARESEYYESDPEPFHARMNSLANYLESCGL